MREKRAELHDARTAFENAKGQVRVHGSQAEAAQTAGWSAEVHAFRASAEQWDVSVKHHEKELSTLHAEIARLAEMSEAEFKAEQKLARRNR